MQTFFQEYLNILQKCHDDILRTIEGLPPAALDWIPGPETNSISVLVFHVTGSERYWIGDVAMRESSDRDREMEFKIHDVGVEILKKRLEDSLAYARTVLDRLTLNDLERERIAPKGGKSFTVAFALLHALEHAMLHLGHIEITSQLWKQSKGIAV